MERILPGPFLICPFAGCIRRQQVPFPALLFGKLRLITIHTGTGSIYELFNMVLSGCFQHIHRPCNIIYTVQKRHLYAFWHRPPCRLMKHKISISAGTHTVLKISDIPFDKFKTGIADKQIHIFHPACGKIVQAANPASCVQNRFAKVRADKTRPACDKKQAVFWKSDIFISHNYILQ